MSAEKQLLERVRPLIAEHDMLPAGATVLCAVSGGIDSMTLLYFLHSQAAFYGVTLRACHFDHGLRPASGADAEFVRQQCGLLGIPLDETRQDVARWAEEHHMGTEEAGRQMRYAWFDELARRWDSCVIATAHNADDNVETMLLHLTRGAGLNGLGGISPRRGRIIRPFLTVPRRLIQDYAEENRISHVEDETNGDPAYTPRNLLRAEVIPLLKEINPNLTDVLSDSLVSLRQDEAFLEETAAQTCISKEQGCVSLPLRDVTEAHPAVAARRIQRAAELLDDTLVLSSRQRQAVIRLCLGENPSGKADLARGYTARRVYDRLVFVPAGGRTSLLPLELDFEGERNVGEWNICVTTSLCPDHWRSSKTEFYLSASAPVLLRSRTVGDTLRLPYRKGTKTLKKWFIEEKIPAHCRERIPVLEQNGQCAAVWGLGTDAGAMPGAGERCLHILIAERKEEGES